LSQDQNEIRIDPAPSSIPALIKCPPNLTSPSSPPNTSARREKLKIISGGQTGADRAALEFAIIHGIAHGGWCSKVRRAEDGPIDPRYQLQETPNSNYLQRTEWNVRDSDGTVIFSIGNKLSGGSLKTLQVVQKHEKPWIYLSAAWSEDAPRRLLNFLEDNKIRVLNVAGPRASKEPEVGRFVTATLHRLFNPALIYVVQGSGLADHLKQMLELAIKPKCIVRPFSDPNEALKSFTTESCAPDLLITGWLFKTLSGKVLLQEFKKLKPGLKVILFAFSVRPEMEKRFKKEPWRPNAYIPKTLDPDPERDRDMEILIAATRKLLRSS
jgi:hypothetical protein